MTDRWTPASWRDRPAKHMPADYPDPAAFARVEAELRRMPPLVFAGEARRLKAPAGRRRRGQGLPAAGRRLRRELQGVRRRQHPRHLPPDPADGGGADLRRRQAGGEGRPHRRPVRQAALGAHRDHRRRHPAVLPRRQHQRHGVRRRPRARPIRSGCSRPTASRRVDAEPAARLRRRRLRRPAQHPPLDPGLRRRQPAGRALPRAGRQDLREP